MPIFDEYLTKIIESYTARDYTLELQKAKKEFFGFIGAVHEEDSFYENYMTVFIEWYIFDRDLTHQDLPPVRLFYRNHYKSFNEEEKNIYSSFTKGRHSLFLAKKVKSSFIELSDLFRNEKIKIENQFPTAGFSTGDIFEGNLILFQGKYTFTRSFIFHPPEAKSFLTKEMKRIENLEPKILQKTLLRLKRLRLKYDRYPHVSPTQIYTLEEFNRHA